MTLVVNTTEDKVSGSDGKLSLREAIAEANSDPRPHQITFKGSGLGYHPLQSALEIKAKGALTIDGDANDDGVADVVLSNGFAEKLIIRAGADVTIIGMDFYGGSGAGDPGVAGARGTDGGQGLWGVDGKVSGTTVTKPTSGKAGGDGKAGRNGTAGENAAGIIRNFGKLHLVRVGMARGYATAGWGGNGGSGGWGGAGGGGGDGIGAGDEFCLDREAIIQNGAGGGAAGSGADGGNGGPGGSAAGAILNEASGVLELTDVAFGGRLSGWLVADGSTAIAAKGGFFGPGGDGGTGGTGGDGGDQDYVCSAVNAFIWNNPEGGHASSFWEHFERTKVGKGGEGGDGGNRGDDGKFGKPGDAASALLNLGKVKGEAAIGADGKATGAPAQSFNPGSYTNGKGGLAGYIGALRQPSFSFCPDIDFYNNSDFTQTAISHAPGDYILTLPDNEGRLPSPGRSVSHASNGVDGKRTKSIKAGRTKLGILNSGSGQGTVKIAASLVFVHPLGVQKAKAGKTLDFNIVRLGKGQERVTVKWEIQPAKKGPSVSPADFGKGKYPSGNVTFAKIPGGAVTDTENSVKRVSIPIKLDTIDEPAEGYRMVLTDASAASVLLGTSVVEGKLQDGSP